MKFLKTFILLLMLSLILTAFLSAHKQEVSTPASALTEPGFAVLELFTSEGCSSCPPADDLMGQIHQRYRHQPVYVLAYHVDYWDRNGWKDVFSNAAFTERQYKYSHQSADQVYTPQVIVNGRTEFVGSDAAAADAAIGKALNTKSAMTVSLTATKMRDSLVINYSVTGNTNRMKLVIAVVQKNAMTQVKGGENKGRVLSHWQVVRSLHSFEINAAEAEVKIALPEDFDDKDWAVIGFLQKGDAGSILAANKATITNGQAL